MGTYLAKPDFCGHKRKRFPKTDFGQLIAIIMQIRQASYVIIYRVGDNLIIDEKPEGRQWIIVFQRLKHFSALDV